MIIIDWEKKEHIKSESSNSITKLPAWLWPEWSNWTNSVRSCFTLASLLCGFAANHQNLLHWWNSTQSLQLLTNIIRILLHQSPSQPYKFNFLPSQNQVSYHFRDLKLLWWNIACTTQNWNEGERLLFLGKNVNYIKPKMIQ